MCSAKKCESFKKISYHKSTILKSTITGFNGTSLINNYTLFLNLREDKFITGQKDRLAYVRIQYF